MRGKRRRAERSVEQALTEAARAVEERIATCHERVVCPRCVAPVGERCIRARRDGRFSLLDQPLKHSHAERLRADGISLR